MKVIRNRFIPFGRRFLAINLFGVLFTKGYCSPTTINHERIHTAQMKELAYVFFYVWYVAEWMVKLVRYGDSFKAYRNISFEREAYENEGNTAYLNERRHFAFIKNLF